MSPPPASSGSSGGGTPPDPERAWRESFDQFERMIGKPLEEFLSSDQFADAAAEYPKAHANVRTEMEKGSEAWLRMWNMPSAGEVRELRRRLDDMSERLEALERRIEDGAK